MLPSSSFAFSRSSALEFLPTAFMVSSHLKVDGLFQYDCIVMDLEIWKYKVYKVSRRNQIWQGNWLYIEFDYVLYIRKGVCLPTPLAFSLGMD